MGYLKIGIISLIGLLSIVSCRKTEPIMESTVIGSTLVDLSAKENTVRRTEALLGNLICDAIYFEVTAKNFNCDFAMYNSGGIRYDALTRPNAIFPKGSITNIDVEEMVPFGNQCVLVKMNGTQLKQVMERSIAQYQQTKGAFLQFSSGVEVHFDTLQSPQLLNLNEDQIVTPGNRVLDILVNGVLVDPNSTFVIAMPDYLAEGFDGYVAMQSIPTGDKQYLEDQIISQLTDFVITESPLSPQVTGRIIYD